MFRLAVLLSLFAFEALAAPSLSKEREADWVVEIARSRIARASASQMTSPPILVSGPVERVTRPDSFEIEIKSALGAAVPEVGHVIDLRDLQIFASTVHGHLVVCGEANARNRYGAITDFDRFAVVMSDPDVTRSPQVAAAYGAGWISASCDRIRDYEITDPTA